MPPWTEQTVHVVDFEGRRASGVLEYGVATLRRGEVVAVATRLCRATGAVSPRDTLVHGLRARDTAGHPPFADDFELFRDFRRSGPLAAHHAPVEHGLLKSLWPYPPFSPDFRVPGAAPVADWGPWLDTCRLYQALYPALPEHKLGSLVAAFGLGERLAAWAAAHCPPNRLRAHCALYDALAAALLLARLAEVPELAGWELPQLLAIATPPVDSPAAGPGELPW